MVELAIVLSEEPEVEALAGVEVGVGVTPLDPIGVEKAMVALAGLRNEADEPEATAEAEAEEVIGLPHPEQNLACRGRFFLPQEEHA